MDKESLRGLIIVIISVVIYYYYDKNKRKKLQEDDNVKTQERQKNRERQDKISKQKIEEKFNKLDLIQNQLELVKKIEVIEVSDYKKIIIDNEKEIINKSGDEQLYSFLKIDSFLTNIKKIIENDIVSIIQDFDEKSIKKRILEEEKRPSIDKAVESLQDISAKIEGKETKNFEFVFEKLYDLGMKMKPALELQVKTLEIYKSMAIAMVVFYLNDKKIRYFEIHEAFEKLGVFDSTFEKNVLSKLGSIEARLNQIGNQLTEMNSNFKTLIESNESIIKELKEIDKSIMTSNLIQSFTAYQTWKINKNTKIK